MSGHKDLVKYCVDNIIGRDDRPLLVAVTGDSGSGKSHFVKHIETGLRNRGVEFVHIDHDDFLVPRKDRELMKNEYYTSGEFKGKSKWEILENMFMLDKYMKVIADLKSRKSSTYRPYLRELGDISKENKTIPAADVVIFDTSMLVDQMDFVILIDADQDEIISRKVVRDKDVRTPEQIIDMHKRVQGFYWERMKPKYADIIIDNNDYNNPRISKYVS